MTANSREPNLATALLWLVLAAAAVLLLLGGINFLTNIGEEDTAPPTPAETVTTYETRPTPGPSRAPILDEDVFTSPLPGICATADVSRTRWSPCGQLLGYFDDETPNL
ncbi:hypothetical protein [Streptomyces sp. NPDC058653]|uniref:hypothetical protein n=1 Tax=Streptomyces sp. NPDC058653 TaxID=3346576 RepID=UPI00366946A6